MSYVPALNFPADALLDPERLKRGPMVMYWNQEGEVRCNHELSYGSRPNRRLWHRLTRRRPWKFSVRVVPPKGVDLDEFGAVVSQRVRQEWPKEKSKPSDLAVWMPGTCFARTAPEACGVASKVLRALEGIDVASAQVWVERFDVVEPGS